MILTSRSSLIQRDMSASALLPSGFNMFLKTRYKNTFKTPPDDKKWFRAHALGNIFRTLSNEKVCIFQGSSQRESTDSFWGVQSAGHPAWVSFVICVCIDVELSAHCGAPHRKRNILWIFCEYSLDIAQDLFTFLLPISTSHMHLTLKAWLNWEIVF